MIGEIIYFGRKYHPSFLIRWWYMKVLGDTKINEGEVVHISFDRSTQLFHFLVRFDGHFLSVCETWASYEK